LPKYEDFLSHEEVLQLRDALVAAGFSTSRRALFVGIDTNFVASLPVASSPGEQLLVDLDSLNRVGALRDGTTPMLTWLRNAASLTQPRAESAVFERALASYDSTSTRSTHIASQPEIAADGAARRR
jgi:endonuclease G